MKRFNLIAAITLLLVMVIFSACNKKLLPVNGPTTQVKSSIAGIHAIGNLTTAVVPNNVVITKAIINIANVQIEENSGNDGENVEGGQNNNNDSTDNDNEKKGKESESDNENILMAGPFSLDITNGSASIDKVNVYPGTFKKVNFDFQTTSIAPYYSKSIVIGGKFTTNNGKVIPFSILSAFSQKIQLHIAGNGITVKKNNSVAIDIIFDVGSWLDGIDFSKAQLKDNIIIIDDTMNNDLLKIFEANLSKYIDVEKE